MDTTILVNHVSAPKTGDDGEAMAESEKTPPSQQEHDTTEAPQTEAVMPNDAGWYVAVVRCNCEKKIADSIKSNFNERAIWFDYWVPMQKTVYLDKRSNKRRKKDKVLLTTFIFCHVSPNYLDTIRFRSDIYKMLTMPGQREIYRIRDKELDDYRRIVENPDLPITTCSAPLRKGQKVRITGGKMAGLEAYVQRLSNKKAVIGNEIKYICGATIEIDRCLLEVIHEK